MTLPNHWRSVRIGDICELANGMAFKASEWATSGLPIIRIQNLNNAEASFNYCATAVEARFMVEPGELLFAWSGTPGTSFGAHIWSGPAGVLNQHIFRVRFDEQLINKAFLRDAINVKLDELIRQAHGGVGLAHVTKGVFQATVLGLPTLDEQRQIVARLDVMNARMANALSELKRVKELTKRFIRSSLSAVLHDETSANNVDGSAVQTLRLGDIAVEGPSNGWSAKSGPDASGTLTLKLTAITRGTLRLDEDAVKRIYKIVPAGSPFWLRSGDLLIQRANSLEHVGASAIFDGPDNTYIYPDLMMRLRFPDLLTTRYMWHCLNSPYAREYFRENATGTAGNMPKINGTVVRNLAIPMPPKERMRYVVDVLDAMYARVRRVEADTIRAIALISRARKSILHKAFSGQLTPIDTIESLDIDGFRKQTFP